MSTLGSDLVSAFTIRELTGKKRTLTLKERALPYRPFELGGSMRNSVDWYVGSPIGTVQVFGAKEEPTTINGMWKDAFLAMEDRGGAAGRFTPAELLEDRATPEEAAIGALAFGTSALQNARALVDVVDSFRRCGQELEVTWLNHVRRGIMDRFTHKWHTGHDVEWEILFTWSSQGESFKDVAMRDDTATGLGDLPNKVFNQLEEIFKPGDFMDSASALSAALLGGFSEIGGKIAEFAENLTEAVQQGAAVLQAPAETMRRVAGILDGIKLAADDLSLLIENAIDGAALDSASDVLSESLQRTFGDVLTVRANCRERAIACKRLRDLAANEQDLLLSQVTSTLLSVFQAREGQDLREVAANAYGDPDAWRGLMVYNQVTTSRLRAGQVVFVPAQPPDGGC